MKRVSFLIAIMLIGCKSNPPKKSTHILDFGTFTIETPANWQKYQLRGADSYVGGIQLDSGNRLEFDYGIYSWDLSQYDSMRIRDTLFYIDGFAPAQATNYLFDSAHAAGHVRLSHTERDTINGFRAKIVFPRHVGRGFTGVYFDSIGRSDTRNVRLSLCGDSLSAGNQKAAIEAFRTIKFKKRAIRG